MRLLLNDISNSTSLLILVLLSLPTFVTTISALSPTPCLNWSSDLVGLRLLPASITHVAIFLFNLMFWSFLVIYGPRNDVSRDCWFSFTKGATGAPFGFSFSYEHKLLMYSSSLLRTMALLCHKQLRRLCWEPDSWHWWVRTPVFWLIW